MKTKRNICTKCEAVVPEGGRFCPACGEAFTQECPPANESVYCASCGNAVGPGVRFCMGCGAPVSEETASHGAADAETGTDISPRAPSSTAETAAADGVREPVGGSSSSDDDVTPHVPPQQAAGEMVLRIVSQENCGREFPLAGTVIRIGKESDADIALTGDNHVSHAHARILVRERGAEVEDLGSRNGTFLEVRDRHVLQPGDRMLIGTTVLEYSHARSTAK